MTLIVLNYAYVEACAISMVYYDYPLPGVDVTTHGFNKEFDVPELVQTILPISFFTIDCIVLLAGLVWVCTKVKSDLKNKANIKWMTLHCVLIVTNLAAYSLELTA